MEPAPQWIGDAIILPDVLSEENGLTEEKFREFLIYEDVPRTCEHLHALGITPRRSHYAPFGSQLLQDFCHYLERMMIVFIDSERERFINIMMEHRLPFDLYLCLSVGFDRWICESRIKLFELYFAQGYTMRMLRGRVEGKIVHSGNVDVLDFFLALETPETGHVLKKRVVLEVCRSKNVDMLDRLINKGYPVNLSHNTVVAGKVSPICYSFSPEYHGTDILDRLIMAGADVNSHMHPNTPRRTSILYQAFRWRAVECFQRLLDVGARIRNDVDTEIYFTTMEIEREELTLLVQSGMDLNYRTSSGTALEIVSRRSPPGAGREEDIALVRELGGK